MSLGKDGPASVKGNGVTAMAFEPRRNWSTLDRARRKEVARLAKVGRPHPDKRVAEIALGWANWVFTWPVVLLNALIILLGLVAIIAIGRVVGLNKRTMISGLIGGTIAGLPLLAVHYVIAARIRRITPQCAGTDGAL